MIFFLWVFFTSQRLLCCTPLVCKKNIVPFKTGVCLHAQLSVSSLHCLVSYIAVVAVARGKSTHWTSNTNFCRDELNLCHQNIEQLIEKRDDLEKEIERQKAADDRWVKNEHKCDLVCNSYFLWDVSGVLQLRFPLFNLSAVWLFFVYEPSIGISVKNCREKRSWKATSPLSWSNESKSKIKRVL